MTDLAITVHGKRLCVEPIRHLGEARFILHRNILKNHGGQFDSDTWKTFIPSTVALDIVERLRGASFSIAYGGDVPDYLRDQAAALTTAQATDVDPRLRGYQREGVAYLRARQRAMLADEMGIGKTLQALSAAPHGAPLLVIAPALAKGVWVQQAREWGLERRCYILSGRGSFRWPRPGELVVINYDILPPAGATLPPPLPGTIIVADEAHYCKGKTGRQAATAALVKVVTKVAGGRAWALTGTPLANWPPDLYRVLATFGLADVFGGWPNFVRLFAGTKDRWGKWSWGKPHASVPQILSRVMLRRTRAQVLPQLPKKSYSTISVPLAQSDHAALTRMLQAAGVRVSEITADSLSRLLRSSHVMAARKLLAAAKIKHAVSWVEECEESNEPVIVFSAHRGPVLEIGARDGWRIITGDVTPDERTGIAADFQAGRLKGIAATIDAGGVAITLTRACMALFVDLEWTPAANSQAEDRILRLGQERPVTIYRAVAEHELDEKVAALLQGKQETLQASIEAITSTSDAVLAQRLNALADAIELESL
ncbi:MAG: DEAD/DEAH box helicase [Neisseriaceae bacterium]|nr:MAG: DEAD/DEAH box helicase [Neisseriaceae bacterium]